MSAHATKKVLNLLLILTSLIGYTEWGGGNSAFFFQTEFDLIFGDKGIESFMHPFVLVPLLGQVLLLITLFQKEPSKKLTLFGMACISIIMLFLLFIGVLAMNMKVIASALPFIIVGLLVIRQYRKKK